MATTLGSMLRKRAHAATDSRVQNHGLEIFATAHGAFVSVDRFDAISHGRYFVTECIQQLRGEFTNSFLIVHDEDPLQRRRHPMTVADRLYHRRFCPGCWKIKGEDRSGRRRLLQMQHTTVFLDDGKANRKSESAAHRLGCEIRIEDLRRDIGWNTTAVIRDRYFNITAAG